MHIVMHGCNSQAKTVQGGRRSQPPPCEAAKLGDVAQDLETCVVVSLAGGGPPRLQLVGEHEAVSPSGPDRAQG